MSSDRDPRLRPTFDPDRDLVTGTEELRALAHPLRLRLLGLLRLDGPSTATRLAQRCGESSGLTSYHLRQLAAAGFVEDADPSDLAGTPARGRERWWKAARPSTHTERPPAGDAEGAAVSADYLRAVIAVYADRARQWLTTEHTWPEEWQELSGIGDVALRLSPAEARRFRLELSGLLGRYRSHDPSEAPGSGDAPGDAVVVSMQYQLFPDPEQDPPRSPDRR